MLSLAAQKSTPANYFIINAIYIWDKIIAKVDQLRSMNEKKKTKDLKIKSSRAL